MSGETGKLQEVWDRAFGARSLVVYPDRSAITAAGTVGARSGDWNSPP